MGAAAGDAPTPVTPGDSGSGPRLQAQAAPMLDTPAVWKGTINGVRMGDKEGKITTGVRRSEKEGREWNTKNLGSRLAVDAACAATAGGLVAPIITMIDQ